MRGEKDEDAAQRVWLNTKIDAILYGVILVDIFLYL
jgi:hypothetical protein